MHARRPPDNGYGKNYTNQTGKRTCAETSFTSGKINGLMLITAVHRTSSKYNKMHMRPSFFLLPLPFYD
ncbi:uncharacterized protein IAS62_002918 [Cryptococcus decagattii]|uniref:Uncharacterized protein n=1 Tax=Cryptococcus decagattii TaxID=1859122 RepID=A0ABZ2AT23_9TREE